jgi:hypothetical protein
MPTEGLVTDWQTTVGVAGIGGAATDLTLNVSDTAPANQGANRLRGRVVMIRVCDADGSNAEFMRATIPSDGSTAWKVERAAEAWGRYPRVMHPAGSLVIPIITASSVEVPIRRLTKAPEVREGRTWRLDPSQPLKNALTWDITGFTYGTDSAEGGRPVLIPPSPYPAIGRILLEGVQLRDVRISVRYRVPADVHPSTDVRLLARLLDADTHWSGRKILNPGNPALAIEKKDESGVSNLGGAAQSVDTVSGHIYRMRFEVIGNLMRFKSWYDGTPEPDWQVQTYGAPAGGKTWEYGTAGLLFQDVSGSSNVSELQVTELLRVGDNLIFNGDLTLVGASLHDALSILAVVQVAFRRACSAGTSRQQPLRQCRTS